MTLAEVAGTLAGAAIIAGGILYKFRRLIKSDQGHDGIIQEAMAMVDLQSKIIEEERTAKSRLQTRLEVVEQERNAMAAEVGQLRATVDHLTDKVSELARSCEGLRGECEGLKTENAHLQETIDSYKDFLQAVSANQSLILEKFLQQNNVLERLVLTLEQRDSHGFA